MTAAAALELRTMPGADAEERGAAVELDLHPALSVLGFFDGVYIVVKNMPAGARLSAGRCNSDFTWSLLPDELSGLRLLLPAAEPFDCMLTVSIITPDPLGYEFASTAAQFNVFISGGVSKVPFNSLRRVEAAPHGSWPGMVRRARGASAAGRPPAAPTPSEGVADDGRRLAAAKAEWQADEEMRLALARARWEEAAEAIWAERATQLIRQHEQELHDRQARWNAREAERVAGVEAQWSARLAASEIRWRAEEAERIAAALSQLQTQAKAESWRRAAGWLLFSVAIGSMVLA